MSINKHLYIRKLDFLNYFDRPSLFWRLNNEEIESIFQSYSKHYDDNFIFEYEQDMDEFIEFDPLDVYENYKIIKLTDESNPRFIEGKIISNKFSNFLINYSKKTLNIFNVIDFDILYPNDIFDLETKAKEILKTILNTKVPTIFLHPIFIFNSAVACPVAITYINEKHYEINFVKGSTGTNRSDVLSLYFQIEITKKNLSNLKNASLFLIAKERKPKGSVSFTIVDSIQLTKANKYHKIDLNNNDNNGFKEKSKYKCQSIQISDLIKGNSLQDFEILQKKDINEKNKYVIFLKKYKNVIDNFWNIITEIKLNKPSKQLYVPFSSKFDSYWLKFNYQREVRKVWGLENELFSYSGKLVTFSKAFGFVNKLKKNTNISLEFFLNCKFYPTLINFYSIFLDEYNKMDLTSFLNLNSWDEEKIKQLFFTIKNKMFNDDKYELGTWKTQEIIWYRLIKFPVNNMNNIIYFTDLNKDFEPLKKKKIYFDFETINPIIRAVDNSFPYAQIITQCSIIKDNGKNEELNCLNLIIDPKNITVDFFKKIIDSLYVNNANEYSFVVYNASFESSRLNELKEYIKDPIYDKKIDAINANLYDLAKWFNVNTKDWYIWIKNLLGFYSIKNILTLLPQSFLDESKTVSYKSLNVQRGDKAQAITSLRFFNALNDDKWEEISNDLCKYCENDVRAMIAVEKFGLKLLEMNKLEPKEFNIDLEIFLTLTSSINLDTKETFQNFLNKLKALPEVTFLNQIKQMEATLLSMKNELKIINSLIKK
ncbi:DUF2779 domain-containing protein [Mycoplasmoides alvi]|uniref:DUF2779 domain-containing protein n=1 Tax=Mycoplasmoides alvi TaxID=78580 RepID=UPI0006988A54|nr:DUF2779 domain-containing protein [Mycoplasmoides alvi]